MKINETTLHFILFANEQVPFANDAEKNELEL